MAAGHRRHGDVFPEQPNALPDEDDRSWIPWKFPRNRGKYLPKYAYPPTFDRGAGRVVLINTSLLPIFGQIGQLGNALYNQDNFIKNSGIKGAIKKEIEDRSYNIRQEMKIRCDLASSLIGEVMSIGGVFHIPHDLQNLVVQPHAFTDCLPDLLHHYFPEEYTVPYAVPIARCRRTLEEILSDRNWQLWETKSLGFCNAALAKVYSELAFRVNRIVYHESLRDHLNQRSDRPLLLDNDLQTLQIFDEFLPKSEHDVLRDNLNQIVILVDKAVDIIDKRFVKEADMLNMMPVDLRDKIMEILIPKWRQPANNVSLLYNEEIKVFKGDFEDPNWPVIPDDLSNLTRMIGVASRDALIQRAGGIVALCRWDPWRVECTQILQRQFHKKIFVYLTTNENKNKLAQAMSEMCLNALKVDIYRARTTVRTSHYGEWLLVHAQDLAQHYENRTFYGNKNVLTKADEKI